MSKTHKSKVEFKCDCALKHLNNGVCNCSEAIYAESKPEIKPDWENWDDELDSSENKPRNLFYDDDMIH